LPRACYPADRDWGPTAADSLAKPFLFRTGRGLRAGSVTYPGAPWPRAPGGILHRDNIKSAMTEVRSDSSTHSAIFCLGAFQQRTQLFSTSRWNERAHAGPDSND
jgi:hypothetical protein